MSSLMHTLRFFILPFFITFLSLALLAHFQSHWIDWQDTLHYAPYWLLAASSLICLQFNRSRLFYIGLLLLCFYTLQSHRLFLSPIIHQFLPLFGTLVICMFCFIKDRGVISVHSFYRMGGVVICGIVAYLWVYLIGQYSQGLNQFQQSFDLSVESSPLHLLPIYPLAIVLIFRLSWHSNLAQTSLGICLLLWLCYFLVPTNLPLSILFCCIAISFLITVLFDSYFLAYRDELTGLPSRRALFNLSLALGRKYTVAMVDIDHFKSFNDTYGHDVGDDVLKLVAVKLSKVTGGGKTFRYGGEEFTIVFPRKDIDQVYSHLDDVRQSIEDYDIVLRDESRKTNSKKSRGKAPVKKKTVNVTVSIGCAEHKSDQSFEQSMKLADKALYRAKDRGRNQVRF
ncbi:GGDEF domain-containing protein [Shewanella sp. 1_MG-2023]|uniref:GGDEF domain-containing protein n=1 Tax=unclassified Shewanella TaxID=196818 RepID=UPI0026E18183|nr:MULTISPECIES: GGDEF domain-containing protein [unclassified Shewanella]MDO6612934.1 GGDEF domain-containing protein [Shewanella sp. 7_MG-2023]MDO6772886.1 GGDEF domain-containing protein [Shewanella sp. 2_MG-2023]MDO6795066.1 GGDEF domain-containing protein [Shewanella sp. 1_MG-2023]